jgi:hypothetical protein
MKLPSGRIRYFDTSEYLVLQVETFHWTGYRWVYEWHVARPNDVPYAMIVEG